MNDLLQTTDLGLYCPAGGFHVDPQHPLIGLWSLMLTPITPAGDAKTT